MTYLRIQDPVAWRRQRRIARLALDAFGLSDASIRLVKYADVVLLRVIHPGGRRYALRMHPVERHPIACLRAELWWLDALRREAALPTPLPVKVRDGEWLVEIAVAGEVRHCALFEWIDHGGRANTRPERITPAQSRAMGMTLARAHDIASRTQFPDDFERWQHSWIIDSAMRVIEQQPALAASPYGPMLRDAIATVRASPYMEEGVLPEYGLIHADPNIGNWLYRRDGVSLIDFEVCAFGYFAFDVARVYMGLLDTTPQTGVDAFFDGYNSIRPAPAPGSAEMRMFLLQNHLDSLGWIAEQPAFADHPQIRVLFDQAIAGIRALS